MPKHIYQIRITLKGIKPPIWRRILVDSNDSLAKLHGHIQNAMGWYDCHLHCFTVGGRQYALNHSFLEEEGGEYGDAAKVKLASALPNARAKLKYEYDFGDSWEHEVVLEKVLEPEKDKKYPSCIDGARACPPENCGGVGGYVALLETLKNPNHPEYEEMREWLSLEEDEEYDAEYFDVAEVKM